MRGVAFERKTLCYFSAEITKYYKFLSKYIWLFVESIQHRTYKISKNIYRNSVQHGKIFDDLLWSVLFSAQENSNNFSGKKWEKKSYFRFCFITYFKLSIINNPFNITIRFFQYTFNIYNRRISTYITNLQNGNHQKGPRTTKKNYFVSSPLGSNYAFNSFLLRENLIGPNIYVFFSGAGVKNSPGPFLGHIKCTWYLFNGSGSRPGSPYRPAPTG